MRRSPDRPLRVVVRITEPARPAPIYQWDEARSALRLVGLVPGNRALAGDLAATNTSPTTATIVVGLDGAGLAPGALVECQVVGGLCDAGNRLALVARPTALEAGAALPELADLVATLRHATDLEAPVRWLDDRAVAVAWEAQRAAASHQSALPVWRMPAGVDFSRAAIDGLGIFDAAPALLEYIPYRFQRYLTRYLLDDERVLFFVERPESAVRGPGWLARRQRRLAAIFLITDRRMLWLEDLAQPDATQAETSHQISLAPLSRLAEVRVEEAEGGDVRLALVLRATGGAAWWPVVLPGTARQPAAAAAQLLRGFLPAADGQRDRRLRRQFAPGPWQPQGRLRDEVAYVESLVDADTRRRLDAAQRRELAEAPLLALARTPAQEGQPPSALALTPAAAVVLMARHGTVETRTIPLGALSGATLKVSVLGCGLTLNVPHGATDVSVTLPFATVASGPFRALLTILSLLLTSPATATTKGPER